MSFVVSKYCYVGQEPDDSVVCILGVYKSEEEANEAITTDTEKELKVLKEQHDMYAEDIKEYKQKYIEENGEEEYMKNHTDEDIEFDYFVYKQEKSIIKLTNDESVHYGGKTGGDYIIYEIHTV